MAGTQPIAGVAWAPSRSVDKKLTLIRIDTDDDDDGTFTPLAAWTTIALGEEMLFRAFLTNGLASLFPGARGRWAFALIGSSVVFGLAHFSWGFTGIVETTIMGLFFGIVYLRSGRNLWITIIAHSLANTLGFILVFAGVGY